MLIKACQLLKKPKTVTDLVIVKMIGNEKYWKADLLSGRVIKIYGILEKSKVVQ